MKRASSRSSLKKNSVRSKDPPALEVRKKVKKQQPSEYARHYYLGLIPSALDARLLCFVLRAQKFSQGALPYLYFLWHVAGDPDARKRCDALCLGLNSMWRICAAEATPELVRKTLLTALHIPCLIWDAKGWDSAVYWRRTKRGCVGCAQGHCWGECYRNEDQCTMMQVIYTSDIRNEAFDRAWRWCNKKTLDPVEHTRIIFDAASLIDQQVREQGAYAGVESTVMRRICEAIVKAGLNPPCHPWSSIDKHFVAL